MKKLLLLLTVSLLVTGCSQDLPPIGEKPEESTGVELDVDTTGWTVLQSDGFTIEAPAGWTLTPEQGIDSLVGNIAGDGMTIHYDFGGMAGDSFASEPENYMGSPETIDSKDAILYVPRSTVEGKMGTFITVSEGKYMLLSAEAKNMQERLLLLEIFRSVKFEEAAE